MAYAPSTARTAPALRHGENKAVIGFQPGESGPNALFTSVVVDVAQESVGFLVHHLANFVGFPYHWMVKYNAFTLPMPGT